MLSVSIPKQTTQNQVNSLKVDSLEVFIHNFQYVIVLVFVAKEIHKFCVTKKNYLFLTESWIRYVCFN